MVHEENKLMNTEYRSTPLALKHKCQICNKYLVSKEGLQSHLKYVHERKKPFKCKICDAKFSKKCFMRKHKEEVHEGSKPLKCDLCQYSCFQKVVLKRHISSVHQREKLYRGAFNNHVDKKRGKGFTKCP